MLDFKANNHGFGGFNIGVVTVFTLQVVRDSKSNKSKGYGFVSFTESDVSFYLSQGRSKKFLWSFSK